MRGPVRYSPPMKPSTMVAATLIALVGVTGLSSWATNDHIGPSPDSLSYGWVAFLYGAPLVLVGALLGGQRWALMAAVMYGTVGLALDISTIVQELTRGQALPAVLTASAVTGVLNFLLIVLGGRGFLEGHRLPSA